MKINYDKQLVDERGNNKRCPFASLMDNQWCETSCALLEIEAGDRITRAILRCATGCSYVIENEVDENKK